eukprot:TRINITY_DN18091_c0_g1_i2.p1 TRINITY_DN18091_c0_g1~~TRINITY_DN18091_c0_g1_i2.p1  ORF type:complete len:163 (+),score=34.38 TRINITY_DN18091_c0_g1_i2:114-602(+)
MALIARRLQQLSRHVLPVASPGIADGRACLSKSISTSSTDEVQLTGHYAKLTGICAEQARSAFRGEVPTKSIDGWAVATFAGGCFWGPQLLFDRIKGVVGTSVGYAQGSLEKPNYDLLCTGRTGHTEAVQVFYDDAVVSYQTLLEEFWAHIVASLVADLGLL